MIYLTRVVRPRSATLEEMLGFHAEDYIQFLSLLGRQTDEEKLEEESEQYGLSMIINFFFSCLILLFFVILYNYFYCLLHFYSIDLSRFRTDFAHLIPYQLNSQNVSKVYIHILILNDNSYQSRNISSVDCQVYTNVYVILMKHMTFLSILCTLFVYILVVQDFPML